MTTDSVLNASKRVSNGAHPNCIVCSADHQSGLKLEFMLFEDDSLDITCVSFGCFDSRQFGGIESDTLVVGMPSVRAQQIVSR